MHVRLCCCARGILCAFITAIACRATGLAVRALLPSVQAWSTCPTCRRWSTLNARVYVAVCAGARFALARGRRAMACGIP
jgi:hypothetical protein